MCKSFAPAVGLVRTRAIASTRTTRSLFLRGTVRTCRRAWPFALAVALGAWLGASRLHAATNADALMPALVSLQALTPYFWRQDRYGMLWAYLWHPLHNPLHLLVAIFASNAAAGLVAQVLLSRLLWPGRGVWRLVAVASMALTLVFGTPHYVAEVLGPPQFFSTPLALGLGGLAFSSRGGRGAGAVGVTMLLVCGWYNPSVPVLLALLCVARAAPHLIAVRRARGTLAVALGLCALATAVGLACMRASAFAQFSPMRTNRVGLWPATLLALVRSAHDAGDLPAPFAGVVTAGLAATWLSIARGGGAGRGARAAAYATVACAAYLVVVVSQGWVRQEGCSGRFLWPVLFVAVVCAAGGFVAPLARAPRRARRAATAGLVATCVLACALRFGPPSLAGVGQQLSVHAGTLGEEALAAQCTHLAGDYWSVWPAVLSVAWRRYEAGDPRPIFGVAHRSEATRSRWAEVPKPWRYCALRQQGALAGRFLAHFGAPPGHVREAPEAPHLVVVEAP